jgi:hypothetical protein
MSKQLVSSTDAVPYQEFARLIGKTPAAVKGMIEKASCNRDDRSPVYFWPCGRVLGLPSSLEQRHETGLRKSSKGDQGRVVDVAWSR